MSRFILKHAQLLLGLFNVLIKNEETSIIGIGGLRVNPTVFDMCALFFMRRQVGLMYR